MIVKKRAEELDSYLQDTSNIKGQAAVLYLPENKEDVAKALKECVQKKEPVTVSCGRTGTTGGCVPSTGAIISLGRLNKISAIDKNRHLVSLAAGVSLEELEKAASRFNLTLRPAPTESLALIGGAVATCASGVRGFGYGSIRKYVNSIEVILSTGEILQIERGQFISQARKFDFRCRGRKFQFSVPSYSMPQVKSQAGYFAADNMDFIDLFIGSEGTLGIITGCSVFLQECAFDVFDGLVFFDREDDALKFVEEVQKLKDENQITPAALEFFDRNSLDFLKPEYTFIPAKAESAVYFEQEAEDKKEYDRFLAKWAELIEGSGVSLDNSVIADTARLRKKVFEVRHKLPQKINEFLRQVNQVKAATDIAVGRNRFREMYDFYKRSGGESGIRYVNFGHIGESHLHFNFLPANEQESLRAKTYIELFCRKAASLAGTISAEHGIGKIKKSYLELMYSDNEINEMVELKKYFDPCGLLGLDNIFSRSRL